ncbi:pyruvoyl-dependent arginine decarboxylase (plasmid) [Lichenicola cladoniae]|uniref:Pyruvoyl-dependent arginine decarboxylase AaxB n=1 Tax=Lichenicola cladoniae TaxID=1484109 RepID=A0A6M8HYR5_9PROT|nr:pyruvoyl-dependent arginine decarboxylase [Lichenicola cladoniae]NPD70195.1 pyruvoyl-dependent arginine decarboxylase [Acetobacteraceae bacterium]QKE93480.1 pyruvoyl-dependent arginine decarboxylase [Lichenicola cladoniae]
MTLGTRFPTLGFTTGGTGEANDGIPPQPYETFCYDSALLDAKIHNFNIIPYTSVLPKEIFGRIVPVEQVKRHFHHGAVLEVIMAATGAQLSEHRAIATGLGICWGKDSKGELIGGWVAEYVEYFQTPIDDGIAEAHAHMWLTKSLNHELSLRGIEKHSEFKFWHNFLNLTQPYGYCLTAMGFLNFDYAEAVTV